MKPECLLRLIAFVADALFLYLYEQQKQILKWFAGSKKSGKLHVLRIMQPRSEEDCPVCRAARESGLPPLPNCTHMPEPWSQVKNNRGRKKTISCAGYLAHPPVIER